MPYAWEILVQPPNSQEWIVVDSKAKKDNIVWDDKWQIYVFVLPDGQKEAQKVKLNIKFNCGGD